jgi:tRNA pseudouridine55 synthase
MGSPLLIDRNFQGTVGSPDDCPDGILICLDKPYKWTSADVVRKIKFFLQKAWHIRNLKVGHAGTLDPLATGVLVICIGKATKIAESLQAHRKEYIATVEFGATTPSYDLEKDYDEFYPFGHISRSKVEEVLPSFLGEQDQVPPVFSAKMVNGVRAYEFARAGEEVELKSSRIDIDRIELLNFTEAADSPTGRPRAEIVVGCSKGTYIRSLARDLGLALGSGAHLTGLIRTASGDFKINNSISLDFITSSNTFAH